MFSVDLKSSCQVYPGRWRSPTIDRFHHSRQCFSACLRGVSTNPPRVTVMQGSCNRFSEGGRVKPPSRALMRQVPPPGEVLGVPTTICMRRRELHSLLGHPASHRGAKGGGELPGCRHRHRSGGFPSVSSDNSQSQGVLSTLSACTCKKRLAKAVSCSDKKVLEGGGSTPALDL